MHGGWGNWNGWGSCSPWCGSGTKKRTRYCNNPAPLYGGNSCSGSSVEHTTCNNYNGCRGNFKISMLHVHISTCTYKHLYTVTHHKIKETPYKIWKCWCTLSVHIRQDEICYLHDYVYVYNITRTRTLFSILSGDILIICKITFALSFGFLLNS